MAKLKREEVEGACLHETHLSNSEHGNLQNGDLIYTYMHWVQREGWQS